MKLVTSDSLGLGVIDKVLEEALETSGNSFEKTAKLIETELTRQFDVLCGLETEILLENRYARFRKMGAFEDLG